MFDNGPLYLKINVSGVHDLKIFIFLYEHFIWTVFKMKYYSWTLKLTQIKQIYRYLNYTFHKGGPFHLSPYINCRNVYDLSY